MLDNEVFEHHSYSLALLPYNFHIFGPFTSDNTVQEAVVQGLGSSTRKSLQMRYADMCINGKPAYVPVENFSREWVSLVHASYKEYFSVVVGKSRWLTL